ncbi:hypothetical protein L596_000654 [Steinernema carpocapsae]|uniref:Uncharacterized protein n=1 Tax=Steinernema carpocapsae TaxID=34508 RepID=A0A4U8UJF3_STECR|nr:hypothetical protein L596_000654 [Steinernema carpocapsae]
MRLASFDFGTVEQFLEDEMLADLFTKKRDAHDRAMYKAKPNRVYSKHSYFKERKMIEESRITVEKREKKIGLDESTTNKAIKFLKNRYDFLKMLRVSDDQSLPIELPYFMQKYEMP